MTDKHKVDYVSRPWTAEWPVEPGWYWFFGYPYGGYQEEPTLHTVRVLAIPQGVMRVIEGNFMYESENHRGVFTKMENIRVPSEEDLEALLDLA